MKISVVIPAYNERDYLPACLSSICSQTRKPDQIIIVDNNSTDNTASIAAEYDVTIIREPKQGIGFASRAGYSHATGDLIVRCDADTIAPSDWLERIEKHFINHPKSVAITGPGRFYDISPVLGIIMYILYMRAYFLLVGSAMCQYPLFGSNFAMRRSAWRKVSEAAHLNRNDIHDDIDLTYHLMTIGNITYDPTLKVGISSRPLFDVKGALLRTRRGFTSMTIHWPSASPMRLYRAKIIKRLNL